MNEDIKPPSRLPDGRKNPEYDVWYRKQPGVKERQNEMARRKRMRRDNPRLKEKARERILLMMQRKSPELQRGPLHHSCDVWHIRSPQNKTYFFKNLRHFIIEHKNLFDESDIDFSNGECRCRAFYGIRSIKPYKKDGTPMRAPVNMQWKGWMWVWSRDEKISLLP
jgi:hypothetical protein